MYKKLLLSLSIAIFLSNCNLSHCITNHDQEDDQSNGKKVAIALIAFGILGIGSAVFIKYGYPCCKKLFKSEPYDPWLGMSTSEIEERFREKQQEMDQREKLLQSRINDIHGL